MERLKGAKEAKKMICQNRNLVGLPQEETANFRNVVFVMGKRMAYSAA